MSEDAHIPIANIGDQIYNGYFAACFSSPWKPDEACDDSWRNAIRTCIQRQADAFKIVSKSHENKPSFPIPAFGVGDGEEKDEE